MRNDVMYAYSAASVAVLYGRLADRALIERMIEAETASDSLKLISDKDYGFTPPATDNVYEYERLIMEEERKLYLKIEELLADGNYIEFFKIKNDGHNIKVILKDEVLGVESNGFLNSNGMFDKNRLRMMIRDRKLKELPIEFEQAITDALESYAKTKSPSSIDIQIDKAIFSIMKRIADKTKNTQLMEIALFYIDSANIRSLIRNMTLGKSVNLLRNTLVSGGTIREPEYFKLLNGSYDQVKSFFAGKPMGSVVEKGLNAYDTSGSLSVFEKLFDEYYMDVAKKNRFSINGPEPVINYYVLKEMEMRNINLIMIGKINRLPKDAIRERVRVYYV